jgi:carboxyl-terminal processing protease
MRGRRKTSKLQFLRTLIALGVFACLTLATQGTGTAQSNDGNASTETASARAGHLRVFDEVWENIRARYYDPSLRGVDWDALRAKFRPGAEAARTQGELYTVLRRMIARLHDPHTRVFAPGESFDWRSPRFIAVGVSVRELGGELIVTKVEEDSEAARAGVRAGDSVLGVDGEPVTAIISRRMEEQAAEAPATARFLAVAKLFDGPRDSFVTVTFRGVGARERSVRLRREIHARTPVLKVRRAAGGVGVVWFNIFTPEIAAQFVRALRSELKDTHSLVVDLRDNGGGEAEAMADIASVFLPPGKSLGLFTDRAGRVRLEPHTRTTLLSTADAPSNFRGPVVVLTGARTASASEVFVAALKEAGRASVVGERSCGCVLGIRRRHMLPDGGILDISEMDYRTARGARLEGAGLEPDEQITPTRRDLQTGRDAAMERAVEILRMKNRK